ncbi:MAG: AhpC/TSA family protein [Rhodobacterales bacterium]|nr:AhpC/TSA family protein [Rhodobacterales bacterium]
MSDTPKGFDEIRCLDAPLATRLAAYVRYLETANVDVSEIYRAIIKRLVDSGAGAQAPAVGTALPDFLLPDSDGRLHGLSDMVSRGPVVISFNRGHWCSFCRLELLALAEVHGAIAERGATLVSIMPEVATEVTRLRAGLSLPFPVLTDIDNGYALSCGLMVSLGPVLREYFLGRGTDLARFQRNDGWFVPIPATFVVGAGRRILGRFVDPDFTRRMAPEELLDFLPEIA